MSTIKRTNKPHSTEDAIREYRQKQALWAAGKPQQQDGVPWCFGCDRADNDCQCGHGARWLGPRLDHTQSQPQQ